MKHLKFLPELVPMVQDGTKTVTRRPIKPQPKMRMNVAFAPYSFTGKDGSHYGFNGKDEGGQYSEVIFPYARLGYTIKSDAGPLRINSVMVERLWGFTYQQMVAEGFTSISEFKETWDTCYGGTEYCWSESPWVWVVEFEVVS